MQPLSITAAVDDLPSVAAVEHPCDVAALQIDGLVSTGVTPVGGWMKGQ